MIKNRPFEKLIPAPVIVNPFPVLRQLRPELLLMTENRFLFKVVRQKMVAATQPVKNKKLPEEFPIGPLPGRLQQQRAQQFLGR